MSCELSRREFLQRLAGAAGLALVGAAGCSSSDDSTGSGVPAPVAPALAATQNPDGTLTVPGGGKLQAGTALAFVIPPDNVPGIVFVTGKGELRALSAKCTHVGCTVVWERKGSTERLHCPCHASNFDTNGAVLNGPAKKPLPRYKVQAKGEDAVITVQA